MAETSAFINKLKNDIIIKEKRRNDWATKEMTRQWRPKIQVLKYTEDN